MILCFFTFLSFFFNKALFLLLAKRIWTDAAWMPSLIRVLLAMAAYRILGFIVSRGWLAFSFLDEMICYSYGTTYSVINALFREFLKATGGLRQRISQTIHPFTDTVSHSPLRPNVTAFWKPKAIALYSSCERIVYCDGFNFPQHTHCHNLKFIQWWTKLSRDNRTRLNRAVIIPSRRIGKDGFRNSTSVSPPVQSSCPHRQVFHIPHRYQLQSFKFSSSSWCGSQALIISSVFKQRLSELKRSV